MSEPDNLVLQQLRELRSIQDRHGDILSGILTRLTGIEQLLIRLYGMHSEDEQRLARLEARVERLEKLTQP